MVNATEYCTVVVFIFTVYQQVSHECKVRLWKYDNSEQIAVDFLLCIFNKQRKTGQYWVNRTASWRSMTQFKRKSHKRKVAYCQLRCSLHFILLCKDLRCGPMFLHSPNRTIDHLLFLRPVRSAAVIYGCEMINAAACCPFISASRPARVKGFFWGEVGNMRNIFSILVTLIQPKELFHFYSLHLINHANPRECTASQ